ncbi:hypothetical protein C0J45_6116 [Silurus meridionalis]|nr:hypothetical protein C0J45_6116 [Silurus meridionalis]
MSQQKFIPNERAWKNSLRRHEEETLRGTRLKREHRMSITVPSLLRATDTFYQGKELKRKQNISSLTQKAQWRMHFLWQLMKFLLPVNMLVNFYTAIIESILKAELQRVIRSAEKVIGCSLMSLQDVET